ncbi:MAG: hypothetical protein AAF171_16395 [Cyanobacteria bacterium P01_A01_bin.116]
MSHRQFMDASSISHLDHVVSLKSASPKSDSLKAVSLETTHSASHEKLLTRWLEKLLQHFGIYELDKVSDQQLAAMLTRCSDIDTSQLLEDDTLLPALKRRIVRLAGAQLDDAFITMAPDVIAEDEVEPLSLSVAEHRIAGVRYQQEVYRFVEAFAPYHRLQAFCLGQTISTQALTHPTHTPVENAQIPPCLSPPYLITQSPERFAVWVNIRALPSYKYSNHLPSRINLSDLGR